MTLHADGLGYRLGAQHLLRDVSLSVGLAACRPGSDPVDLADRAMLVAKRSGRAQLVVA